MMIFDQIILNALSHTTHYTDNHLVSLLLHGIKSLKTVENLLFSIIANRAGVEQYGIRLINRLTGFVICHFHDRRNDLTVCHIHLAAVSFNKKFLH